MKKIFTMLVALACVMSMSALTYNVTVPAGTKVCYIAGEMNSWGHTEMTKVDDTHYTLEIATATATMKYKYCAGPSWTYVEKQTDGAEMGDRTYSENDVVAKWAAVYTPLADDIEAKDITVRAKMPTSWTNTITVWVWETGKAGVEETPTKDGDWYVVTKNCKELNIIFKNGTGWPGDANQTVDITLQESACITLSAGSGKATYTVVDCSEEPGENPNDTTVTPEPTLGVTYNVTVPAGTKACYIAGEMNGWSHAEMTKVDDTHYTTTIADATTAMMYKYCSGPSWDYVEMQADGVTDVQNRTYTENDVVAAWKSVYNSDGTTEPVEIKYVLMGVAGDWETGVSMEENPSNDKEYMLLCQTISSTDAVKVVTLTNGEKTHYCGNVEEGSAQVDYDGDGNIVLSAGIYDFYYKFESDIIYIGKAACDTTSTPEVPENPDDSTTVNPDPVKGVTYDVVVPVGTYACYIAGEMNGWGHTEMTKVDDTHYTLTLDSATTAMKYKYCSGPSWDYVEIQADGVTDIADRSYAAYDTVAVWKAVYDPNASVLPDEVSGVYTIAGAVGLVGAEWDPTATINDMVKQEDGTYVLIKENVELVTNLPYEYKVVKNHAWDIWSIPGWNQGNQTLMVDKSGIYDVTFTLNVEDSILTAEAQLKEELALIPVVQLAGNMTDWANNAITMQLASDSLTSFTTIPLLADSVYQIKVIVGGNWKGYEGVIDRENCTDILFDSEANCNLYADVVGDYTFTWTFATNTLSVDYPAITENPSDSVTPDPELGVVYNVTVPAGTYACYLAGEMTGWSHTEMTKVDDTHYTLTVDTATTAMKYKYSSGPDWKYVEKTATGEDVVDRTYSANDIVEAWASVYDPNASILPDDSTTVEPGTPVEISYVLMGIAGDWNTGIALEQNPADEKEYMLICQTIAEGDAVKVVTVTDGEKTAYCGNVEEGSVSFTSDEHGNIVLSAGIYDFYYKLESDIIYIGKAACDTTSTPEVPENPDDSTTVNPDPVMGVTYDVVVPAGTYACYIAGEMNGWSHTEMTKVDDTHYTLTVDSATTAMKYKYCSGPGWAYVEKTAAGEEVADRTYSANDVVESWSSVYDPNATEEPTPEMGVTYNVTVPAGTYACYLAGEMNGWSHTEMTKVDDTHYTLTVDTATTAMKYKYCSGPGWDYVELQADGSDVQDRTYSENDEVAAWKKVYDPTSTPTPNPGDAKDITVKAKVPAEWTNGITVWVWPTGGAGSEATPTQEGEWYVYTQNCTELNIIFKNGTGWNGDANQTVDMTFTESTCIEITAGSGKATYVVVECDFSTATEDVVVRQVTQKLIYDGQVYLIRDGKMYNVLGQVIK